MDVRHKYDKQKIKLKILDYLRHGMTRNESCDLVGIEQGTLYDWINEDIEYETGIKKSEQFLKNKLLQRMAEFGKKTWQATAWLLERKWSEQFALRMKQDISGYLESSESEKEETARRKRVEKFLADIAATHGLVPTRSKNDVNSNQSSPSTVVPSESTKSLPSNV